MESFFELLSERMRGHHGPLGDRLRAALASLIESGLVPSGASMPSERELASGLGISRTTIRNCLKDLSDQGLVQTRHGAGSVVTGRIPKALSQLSGFTEDVSQRGQTPTSKVLNLVTGPVPPESAMRTGLPLGTPTLTLERLRFADGETLSYERAIVPVASVGDDYDGTGSLYERFDRNNARPQRMLQTLEAISAGERIGGLLEVSATAAVLRISQIGYGPNGQAVEDSTSWYRGDRYRYVGELRG